MASSHKAGRLQSDLPEKSVLLLGAGFVSAPVVEYLSRTGRSTKLTVVTEKASDIEKLIQISPEVKIEIMNVFEEQNQLNNLIADSDLVVSLLPHQMHAEIAKLCIKHQSHMITASYLSPEMQILQESAEKAGVTIVNEAGLDPGIDHLLAMELIDSVKEQGGKITSFVSWCGGLPAPEFSDNPLRYKFSWSPRNVLLNALSPAKYIYQGRVVDVAPGHLLDEPMLVDFLPGFNLEAYPNRDSTTYARLYKLNEAKTVLRATLRYRGFGQAMRSFLALGLIDPQPHAAFDPDFGPNLTWKQIMALLMNMKSDIFVDTLKSRIAERFGGEHSIEFKTLEDLNMLDDEEFVERKGSPLDTLSHYLTSKLSYKKNERDLCLLRHDVTVAWPNGSEEIHHVNLVKYGDANSYSAMASTVGYCTAIMARMILDGEIQVKGHVLPMNKAVYRPVLDRLAKEGIVAKSSKTIIKDDRFVKGMGNQSL